MSLANYSDVLAAVQNWLFGRADLQLRVPEFIALTEAKLNRKLFCRQMEARVTLGPINPAGASPELLPLPADFQSMTRIRLLNSFAPDPALSTQRLTYMTQFQMDEKREELPEPGAPEWFTIYGSELELLPTPDQAYSIEIVYRQLIPALTVSNPTNWLLTLAPDAYLYGTLMEAAPFLHEDERVPVWAAGVQGAVDGLNALSEKASRGAGPLEIRRLRRSYG